MGVFSKNKAQPFAEFSEHILFNKIPEADILEFLHNFTEAMAGISKSSLSADEIQAHLGFLVKQLNQITKPTGSLCLEEFHSNLKLNEKILSIRAQKLDFVCGLTFFMLRQNIRTIEFDHGLDLDDLGELFRIITADDSAKADKAALLKQADVKKIRIFNQLEKKPSTYDKIFLALHTNGLPLETDNPETRSVNQIPADTDEILKNIADIVFEDDRDENDGILGSFAEMPEPESEIAYKRLDEPFEAGESGDTEDMVELTSFDDEGDQLLNDLKWEDDEVDELELPQDDAPAPPENDYVESFSPEAAEFEADEADDDRELTVDYSDSDYLTAPIGHGIGTTTRPPDSRSLNLRDQPVQFVVRVGPHSLSGVQVKLIDLEVVSKTTQGDKGASFDLCAGEHEFEISYDGITINKLISVKPDTTQVTVDLQSISEY